MTGPATSAPPRGSTIAALALSDVAGFTAATSGPKYRIGRWHQQLGGVLDRLLADVMASREPRIILQGPPRHGKTELVGRSLGPCLMARMPGAEVLYGTHTQQPHADGVSLAARAKVQEFLAPHLPHMARKDGRRWTANIWETSDCTWVGVGAGVGTSGVGAHLAVIDDPFGNAEEAGSRATRERVWRWYQSDIETRIMGGGGIVVMHTRWHEDDLVGRLLTEQPGLWRVYSWPALAEVDEPGHRRAGAALVPHLFSRAYLERLQPRVGSRTWAALYQQRPNPAGGGVFRREWWFDSAGEERRRYTETPREWAAQADEVIVTVDSSAKGNDNSDLNAIQVLARRGATVALLERHARRMEYPEFERTVDAVHQRWGDLRTATLLEDVGHAAAYIQRRRGQVYGLVPFVPTRDTPGRGSSKEDRARYVEVPAESGQYLLPRACDGPWVGDYLDTLCAFPHGANDDEVDATSMAFVRWRRHLATEEDEDYTGIRMVVGGAA